MCSSSEAGSYLRLIDFVLHSTLGLRVISLASRTRRQRRTRRPRSRKPWKRLRKTLRSLAPASCIPKRVQRRIVVLKLTVGKGG